MTELGTVRIVGIKGSVDLFGPDNVPPSDQPQLLRAGLALFNALQAEPERCAVFDYTATPEVLVELRNLPRWRTWLQFKFESSPESTGPDWPLSRLPSVIPRCGRARKWRDTKARVRTQCLLMAYHVSVSQTLSSAHAHTYTRARTRTHTHMHRRGVLPIGLWSEEGCAGVCFRLTQLLQSVGPVHKGPEDRGGGLIPEERAMRAHGLKPTGDQDHAQ